MWAGRPSRAALRFRVLLPAFLELFAAQAEARVHYFFKHGLLGTNRQLFGPWFEVFHGIALHFTLVTVHQDALPHIIHIGGRVLEPAAHWYESAILILSRRARHGSGVARHLG